MTCRAVENRQAETRHGGVTVGIDLVTGIGAAAVVAGGLVAAVARPLDLTKGSWLAAYLVLVCGVALTVIGIAQQHLSSPIPAPVRNLQLTGWSGANGLVIGGSLAEAPWVVDAGSLLLLVVLLLTAWVGRSLLRLRTWWVWLYFTLVAIVVLSIPVGVALAHR